MRWLELGQPDFDEQFRHIVQNRRETDRHVASAVSQILDDVRVRGDEALYTYTARFDHVDARALGLRITPQEVEAAIARCPATALADLRTAAARIRWFHEQQRPQDLQVVDPLGVTMGYRWTSMDAVGLYVPGGLAAYPSSVLMNAIPAAVAGVGRVVMVSPTPQGEVRDLVLAAAALSGITEIYRIGGAHAIAALAYGTQTIAAVDKISGPGNAYVAEAKRQVFGHVGIDMIAGPSEIVIIADRHNNPDWIAADFLSQAEHDPAAQSLLICDDPAFGRAVEEAIQRFLPSLATEAGARRSVADHGVIILVDDILKQAPPLANALAAEHLELCVEDPHTLMAHIRHAGSIFLGRTTPEAIGDYLGGPNHVLPTGRRARFSSGLGVVDFMKRTSFLETPASAFAALGPTTARLADAEGLPAHALSIRTRLSSNKANPSVT